MNLQIFCVRDSATDMYGNPMFLIAVGQAVRSFTDEVNRHEAGNQLYAHPDDFELYDIGFFDSNSGLFETHAPALVVRGKDVAVRSSNGVTGA